jgi:metal-responsive CopG/Arc/MetJ family transcriptional regulator
MRRKIIQVPVEAELLAKLDEAARTRGQSRSALIREASAAYLATSQEAEAIRRYVQSYTDMPETEEERAWGELGSKLAAEAWGDEDWTEEYEQWKAEQDEKR